MYILKKGSDYGKKLAFMDAKWFEDSPQIADNFKMGKYGNKSQADADKRTTEEKLTDKLYGVDLSKQETEARIKVIVDYNEKINTDLSFTKIAHN